MFDEKPLLKIVILQILITKSEADEIFQKRNIKKKEKHSTKQKTKKKSSTNV